jgi:hypothetical protein
MASGTVKCFNTAKSYGFIQPDGGGGKDVFIHISAVEKAGFTCWSRAPMSRSTLSRTRARNRRKIAGAVRAVLGRRFTPTAFQ